MSSSVDDDRLHGGLERRPAAEQVSPSAQIIAAIIDGRGDLDIEDSARFAELNVDARQIDQAGIGCEGRAIRRAPCVADRSERAIALDAVIELIAGSGRSLHPQRDSPVDVPNGRDRISAHGALLSSSVVDTNAGLSHHGLEALGLDRSPLLRELGRARLTIQVLLCASLRLRELFALLLREDISLLDLLIGKRLALLGLLLPDRLRFGLVAVHERCCKNREEHELFHQQWTSFGGSNAHENAIGAADVSQDEQGRSNSPAVARCPLRATRNASTERCFDLWIDHLGGAAPSV
jgi:hypothetical protein